MKKTTALTAIFLVILTFPLTPLEAGAGLFRHPQLNRAIVNPTADPGDPPVAERVVMACARMDVELLAGLTGATLVAGTVWDCGLQQGSWGGKPITIAGPMVGAPYAVMVTEKLIALGARVILLLGWCGSLNSRVRIGDLVLPTLSMRGDGTSAYYQPGSRHPSPGGALREVLKQQLALTPATLHQGRIWSTDAIYRETVLLVRHYQRRGCLAVDMESAALFTLGNFRRAQVATLLVVSDELFTLHWNRGFDSPALQQGRQEAARVLLDAAAAYEITD